jgi:hypothetical protein
LVDARIKTDGGGREETTRGNLAGVFLMREV